MRVHLDIETYSEADLKKEGLYRYAASPTTRLLVVCYAFDDGPVNVWFPIHVPAAVRDRVAPGCNAFFCQSSPPEALVNAIESGATVCAHNAQFERVVLSGVAGERHGFPKLTADRMICTAAKAAANGLPRSLEDACAAVGTFPKMAGGRVNMLQLSKPRRGSAKLYLPDEFPEKYADLALYCIDDVKAEQGLDARIPDLSPAEQKVWEMDQAINDRGIRIDRTAIGNLQTLIDQYKEQLWRLCEEWTGCTPTQTEKLANWIRANGYPGLVCLDREAVEAALGDDACPEAIRRVLRLRSTYAMTAVSKYETMTTAAGADDRLRGMLLYHGAGTGRWSAQLVQLQNLFRPVIKDAATAIEACAARDLDWVKALYPVDPMKVFASCIRGMLVPTPRRQFMALDYSGVESRGTAWLYGERWKLQAFQAVDADPALPDTYKLAYARGFSLAPSAVTPYQRQIGKVMELSMGYEGGAGAFVTMAKTYGIDLDELTEASYPALPERALESAQWMWDNRERPLGRPSGLPQKTYLVCDGLKHVWREQHPAIRQGWKDILTAAKTAVANPGTCYGIPNQRIVFGVKDRWLYMRLPSGRKLAYLDPELSGEREDDLSGRTLSYMGVDTKTRQWRRVQTYGGRLTENAVQALCRDLLVNGMFNLARMGLDLVLTVHDEVVAEIDPGQIDLDRAARVMCALPEWAAGLPLKAEGWIGGRYRK